jgi:lysophospholipase L1-like esterase
MSIFSSEFLRGFRPRAPWAAICAVGVVVGAELLLRSGLVHARIRTPAGPVSIPEDIEEPVISGYDPPEIVYSETCGNLGKANYSGTFRGSDFRTELRLNNFGFHDADWTVDRTRDEIRVAVLGMSLTAANQVTTDQTWVQLIESGLNKDGRPVPVEMMNFGVPGHFLANTQAVLENVVLQFAPDIAVLHVAARNIESSRMVKGREYRGYAVRYLYDEDLPRLLADVDTELSSLQQLPIRYSALARLLCHLRGRQPIVRNNAFRRIAAREIEEYDRRPFLLSMRETCRRAGVRFIVLLNGKQIHKLPLRWLSENGIEYVLDSDHLDVSDMTLYGKDHNHFNRKGNQLYAEGLLPVFREWVDTVSVQPRTRTVPVRTGS